MKASDLLWFDCETTGLDPESGDSLLMVAAARTDDKGNLLRTYEAVTMGTIATEYLDKVVREMHTRNGLFGRVLSHEAISIGEADLHLTSLLTSGGKGITLAGNSIHFDRRFIRRYMPRLEAALGYRMLDVSALKVASALWGLPPCPKPESKHLALDDIKDSIAEFHYYEKQFSGGVA